ncbi:MAG: hypothetical protein NVSMB46_08270 [Candidatus Saccharimonadales bacterium]
MQQLLRRIQGDWPSITFHEGNSFFWSPETSLITYDKKALKDLSGFWALFHEVAHASLGHTSYSTDFELLLLEVAAWEKATELSSRYSVTISQSHIQDCLDTYRDWLHERSTCPTCSCVTFQKTITDYACHNCPTTWKVSPSKFCRPYRLKYRSPKEKSPERNVQTTFQ